jgi:hypothetical protein
VKNRNARHIAKFCGFTGKPQTLISALHSINELRQHRGVFFHPRWNETITGHYALNRLKDAKRKIGDSAEAPRNIHGNSADVPRSGSGEMDMNKQRSPGGPPPSPPHGGGDRAIARWAELEQMHPSPQNSRVCQRYLDAMTDEEWEHCRWALAELQRADSPYLSRKKKLLRAPTDVFLRKELWRSVKREKPQTNGHETRAPKRTAEDAQEREAEQLRSALAFIEAKLSDPDVPDDEKERLRVERDEMKDAAPAAGAVN